LAILLEVMRSERVSEKVEAFLWRLSTSLCVNGLGCDVGVGVGFFVGVEAVFLLLLGVVCKGRGEFPFLFIHAGRNSDALCQPA